MLEVSVGACAVLLLAGALTGPVWADADAARCRRARGDIVVDGAAAEAAWSAADPIDGFAAWWIGGEPGGTSARLLCDDEALYFHATMVDVDVVSSSTIDDDRLWLGDVFELFFEPAGDGGYYEFQVNPANARLDLYLPRRTADAYDRWKSARDFGWRTATRRSEAGWEVEGRIPWSDFTPTGGAPVAGATWRFALCRYDYAGEAAPLLSCQARLTRPDFHRRSEWGRLRFAE